MDTQARFDAIETINVPAPAWCGDCGRMLTPDGRLHGEPVPAGTLCPDCAIGRRAYPGPERRQPSEKNLLDLVQLARLLAERARDAATFYADAQALTAAQTLRDLAAATDRAIEDLRQ